MKLLIVEDELRVRSFLARGFEEEGFTVVECSDGPTALLRLSSDPFDLVLLDWMLPGLPGIDVLTQARAGGRPAPKRRPRLDWATLHQRTFGTDVLRCPCGGRRSVRALYPTRKAAEERLVSLGLRLPSRTLPPATAPPQLTLAF